MGLSIKTNKQEFKAAKSNESIYGYVIRQETFPVYVVLGQEIDYIPSALDDKNTEFKVFRNCTVYIAETDKELDVGNYIQHIPSITVKIFT
jgi:hypothetical protein